jgi:Fe-S cluster biogenesis protein NfuA/nitrite reductase/ring-hydroxylating ferredoxin subunit
MNIFSQNDLNGVQEVIKKTNKQQSLFLKEEPYLEDEIADLNHHSQRIQELIEKVEMLPRGTAQSLAQECIQEILSFYGKGLGRILKIISEGNSTAAKDIYNDLIEDSFINGLLLIHDLHPLDLKTRLFKALDKVKPYMDSHGGSIELISLENGVARLNLVGNCHGCPSSSSTLELGIREAIEELCPDLVALEVEGVTAAPKREKNVGESNWRAISGANKLKDGTMMAVETEGIPVIICRADGQLYAYRNFCPACERPFTNGAIDENLLTCRLGHSYDVKHAGMCTGDASIHLDPFPLLEEEGTVKLSVR